jgi:hypothetical protein
MGSFDWGLNRPGVFAESGGVAMTIFDIRPNIGRVVASRIPDGIAQEWRVCVTDRLPANWTNPHGLHCRTVSPRSGMRGQFPKSLVTQRK